MSTPIEKLMDSVEWREIEPHPSPAPDELYATHEGEFEVGGITLRCYTLNDGRRIFDMADIKELFFPDPERTP